MASGLKPKRGPTVLVTDAREQKSRQQRPSPLQRQGTRLISVDSVLQYASEIPSGQRRGPPRPAVHQRTPSGRHPLDPRLAGRIVPQHVPQRSSKVSEKLVLIPETADLAAEKGEFAIDNDADAGPPKDDDSDIRRKPTGLREKSYAERLPKASRTEKLSRVTAYCTAQAYKMRATGEFLRNKHGARSKLYDDCLYTVYHLPLISSNAGYRIRSSPILKSPGGKAVLDEEIERNEQNRNEDFFGQDEYEDENSMEGDPMREMSGGSEDSARPENLEMSSPGEHPADRRPSATEPSELSASLSNFAELFVFSYGVVVFWNFTERQEKDILADLTFSTAKSGTPLAVRPQTEEDFETEQFHFEYNPDIPRPRIFNDMITLRSSNHMIKLAMSHAISQSTKLSFFEERMAETMGEAQYVPRRLALRGELGLKREEVVKLVGKLFTSRVDVNLCKFILYLLKHRDYADKISASNMLDVPNFFWDSEPTLNPLYLAVREYLEIKPRIQVLNERCRVFLDLAEILSDSINDRKMSSKFGLFTKRSGNTTNLSSRTYLDYHHLDCAEYHGHILGSHSTVWHSRNEKKRPRFSICSTIAHAKDGYQRSLRVRRF